MPTFERATSPLPIDRQVTELTAEQIDADIQQYNRLLDDPASENDVHQFLASHSYFFNGVIRLFGWSPLYSKVKLGADYEVDFAYFDSGSFGPEWYLIEIEAPNKPLFTSGETPSAPFTHALQQTRDWHAWIHNHLEYARRLMPHVEYPLVYLFMGRRRDLTSLMKERMRRICFDHRSYLRIHTLDWFADAAHSVKNLVGDSGGHWPVPMNALSHRELCDGHPAVSFEWLRQAGLRRSRSLPIRDAQESENLHYAMDNEFSNRTG